MWWRQEISLFIHFVPLTIVPLESENKISLILVLTEYSVVVVNKFLLTFLIPSASIFILMKEQPFGLSFLEAILDNTATKTLG